MNMMIRDDGNTLNLMSIDRRLRYLENIHRTMDAHSSDTSK